MVPWILVQGRCNNLLTSLGKSCHHRLQCLEMLIAPDLESLSTCNGCRMLPQVKMIIPLSRLGKYMIYNIEHKRKRNLAPAIMLDSHLCLIDTSLGILRNIDGHPYRTDRTSRHVKA